MGLKSHTLQLLKSKLFKVRYNPSPTLKLDYTVNFGYSLPADNIINAVSERGIFDNEHTQKTNYLQV